MASSASLHRAPSYIRVRSPTSTHLVCSIHRQWNKLRTRPQRVYPELRFERVLPEGDGGQQYHQAGRETVGSSTIRPASRSCGRILSKRAAPLLKILPQRGPLSQNSATTGGSRSTQMLYFRILITLHASPQYTTSRQPRSKAPSLSASDVQFPIVGKLGFPPS
jgi:hypothetical protein